ncbi:centrosome assembly protein spindle defective 2 isoform X2 [Anticarsia gemmatalis]|uniref:centrosome assembly protein spindle defective 2 isoform X2 n=1 Tax=Anticarsia gemmatalis TaxID=129554 RepID=UPI003F76BC65
MDNPLTPNKIQRLIHLAEDKSFNMPRRLLLNDDDLKRLATTNNAALNRTNTTANCFGESGIGDLSLSKSTAFNPGEMTGRSTGADDVKPSALGRHSIALESITSQMDKQTSEIQDIMRHSIASNYSFHSKRDLTADEASLVAREAPLPIQNTTHTQFPDSIMNNSNLSVGAYFKNRCPDFGRMLAKTDSPDRSYMPSITEVSGSHSNAHESLRSDKHSIHKMDQTLDCVPVRQPRNNNENVQDKPSNIVNPFDAQTSYTIPKTENINEAGSRVPEKADQFYMSQVPDKPKYVQMSLNSVSPQRSAPVPANKETDLLIKNLHASLRLMGEDTEGSVENSFSISKIADYLGKQSNVSVTDMLQYNNHKKQLNKKQPLLELHMNIPETKKINQDIQVTNLKDSRKAETASSSGTVNTVISLNKYKQNEEIPAVVVTQHSLREDQLDEDTKSKRTTRSKSPSSKSQSTLSTVQENYTSFKSGDSPLQSSKGEANTSHVPSPNIVYKELDKSVDWHEVMQQKRLKQEGLAKEQWVEITGAAVNGYVGVGCPITLTVTTLSDSWLTAKLQFVDLPNDGQDLTLEMPRMPLLLSPGKSEKITLILTSNIEMLTMLNYTMLLKDTSIDGDNKQTGEVEVNIKMPVIQAMSCDGVNKITFPPIQENTSLIKSFVLISDCPADLLLDLSIVDGDSIFTIKNVQEIKKGDVNKVLMDRQGSTDDGQQLSKAKSKATNKQLCRLTGGNAIRVTIKFNAPKLSESQIDESIVTFNGILKVNLIGVNTVLRKVDLIGAVGTVNLVMNTTANKLQLTHEPTNIELCNNGSIPGIWIVKFKSNSANDSFPFKIAPSKFEIRPGATKTVNLLYTGPTDTLSDATLIFEELATGHKTTVEISGGVERPRTFPIKTNYNTISWVRSGRKELSLKNATNKKIYIRCQIVGEGFAIDLPREARGIYCVPFGPCECRPLPIIFTPTNNAPHKATLHLVYDKNSDYSRKITLYGCASGESMRWSGLVTYGDTALVRAVSRMPINLELYNKSTSAAFVCVRVHFNLQYLCLAPGAEVCGGRQVVRARARHGVALRVQWAALERRARAAPAATALATLTVLTGAEYTRRRILKIVRDESNGKLDTSLLPDHLKVLAEKFDGEDPSMDNMIADFKETKASLNELIGGLQELTAQIDLPQDFAEENTILITDDTLLEHHTLCD